ncbi:hydroxyisourate hydrolase [Arthrobacter glacialis]|uniref:5-hydroxyisourate hydrolase n=1 Tax=Arthrobacter glacialis TaxID=1664 RepID=A0A2S3ZZM0_ARTGL|nr:hydroxyisourate hydrolase [Arthrobacter glacialis]POH74362.1 hydroxyisourate hydrolase [Arthrobacter glacialis]
MSTSHITTHVLDTALGRPAEGVAVELDGHTGGQWVLLASGITDAQGRVKDLGPERLESGNYRLRFNTGAYFGGLNTESFFPEVSLTFTLDHAEEHYHVPLLLSPFAFSTYRGS